MTSIAVTGDLSSPLAYSAQETALLLLDFQTFTIARCPDGAKAVATASSLRTWALAHGIAVIHSIINVDARPPPTTKGLARITGMMVTYQNDDQAVSEHPSLAFSTQQPHSREFLSLKTPGIVSGMKAHDCQNVLRENGTKSVIICGLSTSGAVLRTAVPATDDGFAVTVVRDACADRTVELHEVLVKDVLPSRAHVVGAEELMEAWQKAKGRGG